MKISVRKAHVRTLLVLFFTLLFSLLSFTTCSSYATSSSFITRLDEIDSCILLSNTEDALLLLKELSKKAYSASQRLSVYKRYMTLGETKLAEKTLLKALKKLPSNEDILAVYVHFLLKNDGAEKALELSKKLIDTPYASLYAECELKCAQSRAEEESYFFDLSLVPVYIAAWKGSGDGKWLINAATLCMKNESYEKALNMAPQNVNNSTEGLFWGTVFFDSEKYRRALDFLKEGESFTEKSVANNSVLQEINVLASDLYYILGDEEHSEEERQNFLKSMDGVQTENIEKLLPLVYINSARFSHLTADVVNEYKMLDSLVKKYPFYVPGLASYGQFAVESASRPPEDKLLAELRASGLKTLSMEKNDELPLLQVKDALEKINYALQSQDSPVLEALNQQLNDILCRGEEKKVRIARVWKFLEKNQTGPELYPPEVMNFAVCQLIALGKSDDALKIFDSYLKARYGGESKDFMAEEHYKEYLLWENEVLAWERCRNAVTIPFVSREIYNYILENYEYKNSLLNTSIENTAVINSMVNLAVIQSSTGHDDDALELLNKASSRTLDSLLKASILYRMAVIMKGTSDPYSARRTLQYALQLDPTLTKARILLKSLQ